MSAVLPERAGGMGREQAAALVREVSRTTGYRGALQRLAGGSPSEDAWAVRVTAIVTGGGRLVRSREAWARYRAESQQEVRTMVETLEAGPRNGAVKTGDGAGGDGSIRSRVRAWARAHGGELVLGRCADELGLAIKRASDAASQLRADGELERVGKGVYRLLPAGDGGGAR